MHNRIRELLKQSRRQASEIQTPGSGAYENLVFETFAELIVRECSETVQDFVDHRFPASEYPERLKKYFGVE